MPYSSLTNLTPSHFFSSRLPLPSPPLSPLLSTSLYKTNETEVGPLFTEGVRASKGGHTGQDRDRESVGLTICVHLTAHVNVLEWAFLLCAVKSALCRYLHRFWHTHREARCDIKSASSSAGDNAPLWIQKVSRMTWPIHQQLNMFHCLSVYAVESCCLCWDWLFLGVSGHLPVTQRERVYCCQAAKRLLWQQDTGHPAMCGAWDSIQISPSALTVIKNAYEMFCLSLEKKTRKTEMLKPCGNQIQLFKSVMILVLNNDSSHIKLQ